MRKTLLRICFALVLMISMSCSKDDFSWASRFNEDYAGTYRLASATFAPDSIYSETNPIDFDKSGEKTKDIVKGLGITSQDLGLMDVVVNAQLSVPYSGANGRLTFLVPVQSVEKTGDKLALKLPNHVLCPVHFYYSIGKDGDLELSKTGDFTDLYSYYEVYGGVEKNPQLVKCNESKVVKFKDGEIVLSVNLCYIDWTDETQITNTASYFTFKRY